MSGDVATEHSSSPSLENYSTRDPFFVHPADNPNVVLCSPPLNGFNYASWKRGMMRALRVKNKIGFVDGSISKPTDKSQVDEWMRADDLVTGWIHAAILPGIKDSVSYASTAAILWKDLENRYVESCAPKLYQLRQQLSAIKQDGASVMVFYGRLRVIWDEIDVIRPTSSCICANAKDVIDHLNQDRAMEFLQGLHDRFASLHSNILQRTDFPPLLTIYNLVRQEEVQLSLSSGIPFVESATLVVARNDVDVSLKTNKKRSFFCDYCHRDGHTKDRCWKLNGYPKTKRKDGYALAVAADPGNSLYQLTAAVTGSTVGFQQHHSSPGSVFQQQQPSHGSVFQQQHQHSVSAMFPVDSNQGIPVHSPATAPYQSTSAMFPGLSADHLARLAAFAATLPANNKDQPHMNLAGPTDEGNYWSG